jgi:ABC-type cobalamin/Fe3+-siderophores transport system ATPase subunit
MDEIVLECVTFHYPEPYQSVFQDLSLTLPKGIVSLIGQNGTGKTTLMLLAGGILLPETGKVLIRGIDSALLQEESKRQEYISFIYQNLEFETDETIGDLLSFVYENGFHRLRKNDFIPTLIKVLELENLLNKKTQVISKGELQRTIIAFSLLYGSKILMMDEPIFALEERQKYQVMEYLSSYVREQDSSLFYSAHELDLSEKYSDYLLLFFKDRNIRLGPTAELFQREIIEEAYQVPFNMLKQREVLFREQINKPLQQDHEAETSA